MQIQNTIKMNNIGSIVGPEYTPERNPILYWENFVYGATILIRFFNMYDVGQ